MSNLLVIVTVFIIAFFAGKFFRNRKNPVKDQFVKNVYDQLMANGCLLDDLTFNEFKTATSHMITVEKNERGERVFSFTGKLPQRIINQTILSNDESDSDNDVGACEPCDFEGIVNGAPFPHSVKCNRTGKLMPNHSIHKSYNDAVTCVLSYHQSRRDNDKDFPITFDYFIIPIYDKEQYDEAPDDAVWATYFSK